MPRGELFAKDKFHGNTKWNAEHLAIQAWLWSWQETKNVTDAFDQALEVCEDLGLKDTAKTYPTFMNALDRYREVFVHVCVNDTKHWPKRLAGSTGEPKVGC